MKVPAEAAQSHDSAENPAQDVKKSINSELWHACAGPLVSLPPVGSLVVYFPQGHIEQVAATMHKELDSVPNYPHLPSKLVCKLQNVHLHVDSDTDEVYAQMTLQPVNQYDREAMLASELGLRQVKQPMDFFCKALTASDTSTHGGFSVPRRAAEKIFPSLDYTMQPPAQELVAKDLHNVSWKFRHIYRGQPKRHLLTTGWSVFVSTKRLLAGDSVLFIRDESSQILIGIKRANRQQSSLSSSVLSTDSMHIGILAAAAHAAANNTPFTVFYNPRASPSEFVIPLAKYNKALYTQVSLGMRFRMLFEAEDSAVRRHMGTITEISDFDSVRWKNSHWKNLQVGWDESTASEQRTRVSLWEIEPVASPFYIFPPPVFRPRATQQSGDDAEVESAYKRVMPWLADDFALKDIQSAIFPGLSLVQWMAMQQNSQVAPLTSNLQQVPSGGSKFQGGASDVSEETAGRLKVPAQSTPKVQLGQKMNALSKLPNLQQQKLHQSLSQNITTSQQLQATSIQNNVADPQQQIINHSPLPQDSAAYLQQQELRSQMQQLGAIADADAVNQISKQEQIAIGQNLPQGQLLNGSVTITPPNQERNVPTNQLQGSTCLSALESIEQQPSLPQFFQIPQADLNGFATNQPKQLQQLPHADCQQRPLQTLREPNFSPLMQQTSQSNRGLAGQQNLQQGLGGSTFQLCHLQQQSACIIPVTNLDESQPLGGVQWNLPDNAFPTCFTSSAGNLHTLLNSMNRDQMNAKSAAVSFTPPIESLLQEIQSKSDSRMNLLGSNESGQLPNHNQIADQLDASSATSFCLEGSPQGGILAHPVCMESYIHVDSGEKPFDAANVDRLILPGNLMSRAMTSGKDMDTELSSAAFSSHSFGVSDMSFRPGCSGEVAMNESMIPNQGLWSSQAPRMRTYTKVQKRGSVGRTIDVTRYRGYDELRHDLACMFGIQGQLEDPCRTDWKLVYVDHENDILLVGDDPWEEFVNCVKSIKILSAAELQHMSFDGVLGGHLS